MPCGDSQQSGVADNIAMRLACDYLSELERTGAPIPAWAVNWWKEHKEYDKACGRPHSEHYANEFKPPAEPAIPQRVVRVRNMKDR